MTEEEIDNLVLDILAKRDKISLLYEETMRHDLSDVAFRLYQSIQGLKEEWLEIKTRNR